MERYQIEQLWKNKTITKEEGGKLSQIERKNGVYIAQCFIAMNGFWEEEAILKAKSTKELMEKLQDSGFPI